MTGIYLIRHAEPDYSAHDDMARPLTARGVADAAGLPLRLAGVNFTAIYSSPYARAAATVAPLAEALGLPVTLIDGFRERKIADGWIEDFREYSQKQWADFDYKLPGGESLRETQTRNIAALNAVLAENDGGTVAIGTHGTALSTILNYYDPGFGYAQFERIVGVMPYIVRLGFDAGRVLRADKHKHDIYGY